MEITRPEPEDVESIRDVVARSFRASYALSPEAIDALLREQFDESRLSSAFDRDEGTSLVARRSDDEGGDVVGYAEGWVDDAAVVEWLHVAPEARGNGAGTQLFEGLRESLTEDGPDEVRARMLSDGVEGEGFFEHLGMVVVDEDEMEIDGSEHSVAVYADESTVEAGEAEPEETEISDEEEEAVEGADVDSDELPDTVETDEGTFYVDQEETLSGNKEPFLLIYEEAAREDLYGFYCGNCGTVVEAMGGLGRAECEECGNVHRADEWDDSYL